MDTVKAKMSTLKKRKQEAIFQAEQEEDDLVSLNQTCETTEEEVKELQELISKKEDELDEMESQIAATIAKISETEKSGEDSLQAKKILENRNTMDDEKTNRLQGELDQYSDEGSGVVEKVDEMTKEITELEEQLDIEEERFEVAENRVKELELEVTNVGNTLRATETADSNTKDRLESGDAMIDDLEEKKNAEEAEAIELEEQSKELEQQLDELERVLAEKKEDHYKEKAAMEALLNEINEM